MNPDEVAKQLTPDHIRTHLPTGNTDELKQQTEESTQLKPKEPNPIEGPKSKKEYSFDFSWTSPNGKVWTGKFTNKILNLADQQNVGYLRAKFAGGVPADALDGLTTEINMIIAHLTFSLLEKPDWAENLRELEELELIQAIYMEVASHEATFFGLVAPEAGS
jgi:hypothetical protein